MPVLGKVFNGGAIVRDVFIAVGRAHLDVLVDVDALSMIPQLKPWLFTCFT
jgi:hypothetical protein